MAKTMDYNKKMNSEYTIMPVENKKLYGLSVELTKSQSRNYTIISNFWREFNAKLRSSDLPKQAGGNWEKYGITYKTENIYKYFCGIPVENKYVSSNFEEHRIYKGNYAVFQHKGSMYNLKNTLFTVYKKTISENNLIVDQSKYFHFELYNYKFKWNNEASIIEIYIPINLVTIQ
jgi:AraC family transcriptional regulator